VGFEATQAGANRVIAESADEVKLAFDAYASGFLLEDCALAWTTFRDRLGEGGMLVDFPAFQLDMSGAGFVSPVRRSGPDTVSESQREFIDLSFRMSLMDFDYCSLARRRRPRGRRILETHLSSTAWSAT
jgi:hypothetical protein